MYLVLRGIHPREVSILTATKAQESLINEILLKKASWHQSLGLPRNVSQITESQGQSNSYLIVSLVRSSSPGIMSHAAWLTAAIGQAQTGLIVLANSALFTRVAPFKHLRAAARDKSGSLSLDIGGHPRIVSSYQDLYKVNQELFTQAAVGAKSN